MAACSPIETERLCKPYLSLEDEVMDLRASAAILDVVMESLMRRTDDRMALLFEEKTKISGYDIYALTKADDRAIHAIVNQVIREVEALAKSYYAAFDSRAA